jgi:hypothetical protein
VSSIRSVIGLSLAECTHAYSFPLVGTAIRQVICASLPNARTPAPTATSPAAGKNAVAAALTPSGGTTVAGARTGAQVEASRGSGAGSPLVAPSSSAAVVAAGSTQAAVVSAKASTRWRITDDVSKRRAVAASARRCGPVTSPVTSRSPPSPRR